MLRGTDTKLPVVAQWGWVAWFCFATGALCWQAATSPVTDYDAAYLYLFTRKGAEQISLGSFYKLRFGRGYWALYYHDEQGRKQKLTILPLGSGDASSIHGFIDAVWQHNPQLELPW